MYIVLFIDRDYNKKPYFISMQYMMHRLGSSVYCKLKFCFIHVLRPLITGGYMTLPVLGVRCVFPAAVVQLSLSLVHYHMMCASSILPTPREEIKKATTSPQTPHT